ncbi:MAG: DUF1330 domain-containing protein [Saprospiraceae bacterium]|nr:DUF1330 domain-containing protein [Saprospiraceae bacterium]MCB9345628.1 DUF1330 domain-containing protein [Lewinellaceae bacterium]
MINIAQLIFLQEGKEKEFLEFESIAIPLMEKYRGKMLYRIRPPENSFITAEAERPYEIHIISFESEQDLSAFMQDEVRLNFLHLKEESVSSSILIMDKTASPV